MSKLAANTTVYSSLTINDGRNFTTSGDFTNAGTVKVGNGSTFTTGSGAVNNFINSGTVSGNGTIQGTFQNEGGLVHPISLSNNPSMLSMVGNYLQDSKGTLMIDLGGTATGQFSVLSLSNQATLDGTVDFNFVNGFKPVSGEFTFLTFGSYSGDFANIEFTGFTPSKYTEVFGANSLTLVITPTPIPGAIWIFGSGLIGLIGIRKRIKS